MWIETSAEVYYVLMAKHKDDLVCHRSYSNPDGRPEAEMYTAWGFHNADFPLMDIRTTWECDPESYKRINQQHAYRLYITKKTEE